MVDAAALEALADIAANAGTYFSIFVSLTFAYLTAAYFIGAALSRFQCLVLSGIYLVSAALMGFSSAGWSHAWLALKARESTILDEVWIFDAVRWIEGLYLMMFAVVFASLYFMYDARKHPRKSETTTR